MRIFHCYVWLQGDISQGYTSYITSPSISCWFLSKFPAVKPPSLARCGSCLVFQPGTSSRWSFQPLGWRLGCWNVWWPSWSLAKVRDVEMFFSEGNWWGHHGDNITTNNSGILWDINVLCYNIIIYIYMYNDDDWGWLGSLRETEVSMGKIL